MPGLNALPHGIKGLKLHPLQIDQEPRTILWLIMAILILAIIGVLFFYRIKKRRAVSSPLAKTVTTLASLSSEDQAFTINLSRLTRLGLYQRYGLDLRSASGADFEKIAKEFDLTGKLAEQGEISHSTSSLNPKIAEKNPNSGFVSSEKTYSEDSIVHASGNSSGNHLGSLNVNIAPTAPLDQSLAAEHKGVSPVSSDSYSSRQAVDRSLRSRANNPLKRSKTRFLKFGDFWSNLKPKKNSEKFNPSNRIGNVPNPSEISLFFARIEGDLFASQALGQVERVNMKKLALKWIEDER